MTHTEFYTHDLDEYILSHGKPEDETLYALYRETHLKFFNPRMISGYSQGKFLTLLAQLSKARFILEIGTFTGYSAICLAKGLNTGGMLHTIEIDDELESICRKYFAKAGVQDKITLHIGDAEEIVPKIEGSFDIIFLDAEKKEYPAYFELCANRLVSGGLLIADNVLWNGKVLDPNDHDKSTKAVEAFNQMVTNDKNFDNFILPIRDGLMIAQKK
jgi:predicted O-methyltransferase YrrM